VGAAAARRRNRRAGGCFRVARDLSDHRRRGDFLLGRGADVELSPARRRELALAAFLSLRPRVDKDAARFLAAASVSAAVYIAYMAIADVPMYLERWHAAAGTVPLAQGLRTLVELCVVRRDWSAWREDATWLSLYFTVGVWVSITLAHAPRLRISR
jgi:hypothetical protein